MYTFFFFIVGKSEAQRKVVTCPRSYRDVTPFDDGRARIGAKETALPLLGLSSTGWGPEAFISSENSTPSSPLETMRGEMKERVSKRS